MHECVHWSHSRLQRGTLPGEPMDMDMWWLEGEDGLAVTRQLASRADCVRTTIPSPGARLCLVPNARPEGVSLDEVPGCKRAEMAREMDASTVDEAGCDYAYLSAAHQCLFGFFAGYLSSHRASSQSRLHLCDLGPSCPSCHRRRMGRQLGASAFWPFY
ncbi:hypothetical protein LY76DRAFT_17750 [Colletotrichum caudatum]|nr:hypothetical protein LY76DRAFT_17750 [Colletotrichum caudatum]